MPSEQRLHPASLLFAFAASLKAFALPGLLALISFGRASDRWRPTFGNVPAPDGWELWLMLFLIPSGLAAIARYLSFRLRYDETELVIRSGIVFRNERHVPYERIQNLEGVQNVVHRLLRVIEVRIETGAGKEPEASISVLPEEALPDMRRRVFEKRGQAAAADAGAAPAPRMLLRMPLRELLLCGFLENRGLVVIGALYGLLWETGVLGGAFERVSEDASDTPGMLRDTLRALLSGSELSFARVAILLGGILVFLLIVRLLSMIWAVLRLYGFHLERAGEDLRAEFGLITRVTTTIPLRRVQTMTIREGPVYRLASRVTVRVQTAGGARAGQGQVAAEREWLAPIIRPRDLPALVGEVLPGVDLRAIAWQRVHPRAFRRAVKPALAWALGIGLLLGAGDSGRLLVALPVAALWAVVVTRKGVARLGWAVTDDFVAFRSGWVWRSVTIARLSKIQVVTQMETPFDRRTAMARVRVDTAGAGERAHRIAIPYLARETAAALHSRLASAAAATAFRW